MNLMVNMMRGHVPQETRIHYVITHGGLAPNVVPDFAEVYYYVRNPSATVLLEIFPRIIRAAEGAALGTGTTMDYEVIHGIHSLLQSSPNRAVNWFLLVWGNRRSPPRCGRRPEVYWSSAAGLERFMVFLHREVARARHPPLMPFHQ